MRPDRRRVRGRGEELVREIVFAVADEAGIDVLDLPPLADAVDPEAMRALLSESDTAVRLSFDYAGREVRLENDGRVEIHVREAD